MTVRRDCHASRTIRLRRPLHLGLTLGPLRRGRIDPSMRIAAGGVWRATRTPEGPVTTRVSVGERSVTMDAWGPGGAWSLDRLPALVGEDDDDSDFRPREPVVARLRKRLPGLRIGRSGAVVEALVPTIIEQKVVGLEAKKSYAGLVRAFGEPAPVAPLDAAPRLVLPPDARTLAATPSYEFHRFGIERRRADTIRRACSYAARLEEAAAMAPDDARRRLTALPGIGPWTAAEVALVAMGDPDAVSVGDYHLPHQVAWALAGEARADDDRMLELLEPYRGHRGRVIRLIVAGAPKPPRFGPRMPMRSIANI